MRFQYRSSDEVLHILSSILCAVQRARISLIIPKKKPIDELMKSRNMVSDGFLGLNEKLSAKSQYFYRILFILFLFRNRCNPIYLMM